MDDLIPERIDVLGLFLDILFMDVCTTRHWQMSGRLVQELNVCTVAVDHVGANIKVFGL